MAHGQGPDGSARTQVCQGLSAHFADLAQNSVDITARGGAVLGDAIDPLCHRGVGRHAIHVQELVRAQAESLHHVGPYAAQRIVRTEASTASRLLRRRTVPATSSTANARSRPSRGRSSGGALERQVHVAACLLQPVQDRERRSAGRAHGRGH